MTHDDHDDTTTTSELARRLLALDQDPEEDGLFPESFMQEFTDFKTWDEFKVRLAATPRPERVLFMTSTTRFGSYEEMERVALERLAARRSSGAPR